MYSAIALAREPSSACIISANIIPIDIVDNKLCKDYKYLSYVLLVFNWITKLKTSSITFINRLRLKVRLIKKLSLLVYCPTTLFGLDTNNGHQDFISGKILGFSGTL